MWTAVSQTAFLSSSMQYQMRPPPVTSNCHWGISMSLTVVAQEWETNSPPTADHHVL